MKHQINSVKEFHEVYRIDYKNNPTAKIPLETIKLRFNFCLLYTSPSPRDR